MTRICFIFPPLAMSSRIGNDAVQFCFFRYTVLNSSTALVRAGQGLKKKPRMRVGPRAALRQRQRSLRAGSVVARGTKFVNVDDERRR